eukprot:maker-scaffold_9-snap-gene-1.37-mRNA-1 protein AED:0.01 eAED:0.01 QI:78/1/1/1/1/1/3/69/703
MENMTNPKKEKKVKKSKKQKKEKKSKKSKRKREDFESTESVAKSSLASETTVTELIAPATENETPRPAKKRKLLDAISSNKENEDKALSILLKNSKPLEDYEKTQEICQDLIQALRKRNMNSLFEIQVKTFPIITKGKDLIGRARTGCGKTLAFALPVLQQLLTNPLQVKSGPGGKKPQVLVLSPTRELAKQISKEFELLSSKFETLTVYGGTSINEQVQRLRRGVDIAVGTPGRVIDLIERGELALKSIKHFILDEADQMLDMGFKEDMDKIFNHIIEHQNTKKKEFQVLLFSATLPAWVNEVAAEKMKKPVKVDLVGDFESASKDVKHLCLQCPWDMHIREKIVADLVEMYAGSKLGRVMVFCATKKMCDDLSASKALSKVSRVIHGDVKQEKRESTLKGFRNNGFKVLIATDVASRGLDIKNVDLVINFEPPSHSNARSRGNNSRAPTVYRADVDSYVHRSGRTGRAGKKGVCVTLYTYKQKDLVSKIEQVTSNKIERIGSPQIKDLVLGAARSVTEDLVQVLSSKETEKTKVLEQFKEFATELVDEFGATDLIAGLLAVATGYDDPLKLKSKSMLSARDGFVTVKYENDSKSDLPLGYVWGALRGVLGHESEAVENIFGMTLLENGQGAVFDMREEDAKVLSKLAEDGQARGFELCDSLPELKMTNNQLNGVGRSFTPGRGGSRRGRGGFGRRGRGRRF